jgi:zinc protease
VQAVAAKYFGDEQLTNAVLLPQPVDPNSRRRQPRGAAAGTRH